MSINTLLSKEAIMRSVFWIVGSFFYFYQFFFRTIFSTIGDEVARIMGLPIHGAANN